MKKLVKLAVASAVVFGTSAFAGDNNNAALVLTESDSCMAVIQLDDTFQNILLTVFGTSVHLVDNKNMTKAVCQIDNFPSFLYGEESWKVDIATCTMNNGTEEIGAQTSELKVPSEAEYLAEEGVATVQCTFREKDAD